MFKTINKVLHNNAYKTNKFFILRLIIQNNEIKAYFDYTIYDIVFYSNIYFIDRIMYAYFVAVWVVF